jgi:hypothetical protein
MQEWERFFGLAMTYLSVYNLFSRRTFFHHMAPLTALNQAFGRTAKRIDDTTQQWVIEVETWFMKALLNSVQLIQDGALYPIKNMRGSEE